MSRPPLNAKQLRFVELYQQSIADGSPNAAQAYTDAYPGSSPEAAKTSAARLLTNANVQQLLAPARQQAVQSQGDAVTRIEITRDRIRLELARLSFFNPKRMFNPDGTVKGIHELDDDTAAALAGIEVEEEYSFDGAEDEQEPQAHGGSLTRKRGTLVAVRTKKFKFWDKGRSLRTLWDTEPGVWADGESRSGGEGIGNGLAILGRFAALCAARQPLPGRGDGGDRVVALEAEPGAAGVGVPEPR